MKDSKAPYEIVYEDNQIIVVYKKRDVLTIRTNDKKTYSHNLYHYLKLYLNKKGEELYIVHRLDYETSGLLIFAKSGVMKEKLQNAFKEKKAIRDYECVVEEKLETGKKIHVEQYLVIEKDKVYPTNVAGEGKLSITDIETKNPIQIGTSCLVHLLSGRRNQIRLAIASLGLTLIGDKRYSHSEAKRMYLNAFYLAFPKELKLKQSEFKVEPLWIKE